MDLKCLPLHRSIESLIYCAMTVFSYTSNLYWMPFSSWIPAGTPGYLQRGEKKKQKPTSTLKYHYGSLAIDPTN